eukprot:COSAG03_NODE_21779_length_299_cov_1.040000_1_plen_33_part_10
MLLAKAWLRYHGTWTQPSEQRILWRSSTAATTT